MKRAVKIFLPAGSFLSKIFPWVKTSLMGLDIEISPEEFFSSAILFSIISFLIFFIPISFIGFFLKARNFIYVSLITATLLAIVTFFYKIFHLKILVSRRIKLLEKDLLFALRHLYIKVKSGIPLYDAMVSVAYGNFGEVSKEFKKTVKEISGGIDEIRALENMALRSPSLYLRRVIWQITNNLRAGADISDILGTITASLVREHKILIRRYGSELNPIILTYMMFTVVFPSLGSVVIVVMSAFSGIKVPLFIFYIIPIFVFALQLIFLSVIKNKRPLMVI